MIEEYYYYYQKYGSDRDEQAIRDLIAEVKILSEKIKELEEIVFPKTEDSVNIENSPK